VPVDISTSRFYLISGNLTIGHRGVGRLKATRASSIFIVTRNIPKFQYSEFRMPDCREFGQRVSFQRLTAYR